MKKIIAALVVMGLLSSPVMAARHRSAPNTAAHTPRKRRTPADVPNTAVQRSVTIPGFNGGPKINVRMFFWEVK